MERGNGKADQVGYSGPCQADALRVLRHVTSSRHDGCLILRSAVRHGRCKSVDLTDRQARLQSRQADGRLPARVRHSVRRVLTCASGSSDCNFGSVSHFLRDRSGAVLVRR